MMIKKYETKFSDYAESEKKRIPFEEISLKIVEIFTGGLTIPFTELINKKSKDLQNKKISNEFIAIESILNNVIETLSDIDNVIKYKENIKAIKKLLKIISHENFSEKQRQNLIDNLVKIKFSERENERVIKIMNQIELREIDFFFDLETKLWNSTNKEIDEIIKNMSDQEIEDWKVCSFEYRLPFNWKGFTTFNKNLYQNSNSKSKNISAQIFDLRISKNIDSYMSNKDNNKKTSVMMLEEFKAANFLETKKERYDGTMYQAYFEHYYPTIEYLWLKRLFNVNMYCIYIKYVENKGIVKYITKIEEKHFY